MFSIQAKRERLNELKALLEGVQQTLLEMRTENQRMAAEVTELKSSFKKNSMEISSLKTALKKGAQRKRGAEKVVELVESKSRHPGA